MNGPSVHIGSEFKVETDGTGKKELKAFIGGSTSAVSVTTNVTTKEFQVGNTHYDCKIQGEAHLYGLGGSLGASYSSNEENKTGTISVQAGLTPVHGGTVKVECDFKKNSSNASKKK